MCHFFRELTLGLGEEHGFERRTEVRTRIEAIPARLTDLYHDRLPVVVLNVSRSGLGLIALDKFAVDLPVLVECEGLLVVGSVRHCVKAADNTGYILGVKIQRIVDTTKSVGAAAASY